MSDQPKAVYETWRLDGDYWLSRPLRDGEQLRTLPGTNQVMLRDGRIYCQHVTQAALIDAGVDVGDDHDRVSPAMCAVLLRNR
jgi:hypothetical protein